MLDHSLAIVSLPELERGHAHERPHVPAEALRRRIVQVIRDVGDGEPGILEEPGGALASGEIVGEPVSDWSFAQDVPEVELQLDSEDGSRTVWILVQDGRAYVPCSLDYPPGKRWHHEAVKDGQATLRIEGRRYPVVLAKTDDPALEPLLRQEVDRKYGRVPSGESGVWIFRVTSPAGPFSIIA